MTGFRPRLGPTLFTAVAVLLCLGLGVWQVQRLHWKEGLIAQRQAALAAPPVPAPQTDRLPAALDLHRVAAQGTFLNDKEILVHAIGAEGGAGYDVVTPLRRPDGQIVFVNRGYVPEELKNRVARAAGEPQAPVKLAGLLRLPHKSNPGWFLPDNRPEARDWFWIDLPAMSRADGLRNVAPYYIDADATPNPGGWPKGGETLPPLPNHHLQYAVTWFSLAVAALVIFILSQRKEARDRADAEERAAVSVSGAPPNAS